MKKNEMIIIGAVLLLSVAALIYMNFANDSDTKYVVVTVDGEQIAKFELTDTTDEVFEFNENDKYNKLAIKDGEANVIDANCPNLTCVNTKPASDVGDTIVCLPHKLVVEITAE